MLAKLRESRKVSRTVESVLDRVKWSDAEVNINHYDGDIYYVFPTHREEGSIVGEFDNLLVKDNGDYMNAYVLHFKPSLTWLTDNSQPI